jgi:hypothetical protein
VSLAGKYRKSKLNTELKLGFAASENERPKDVMTAATHELLLQQLDIPWMLASQYYLPALTDELLHWEPSANCVGLRREGESFYPEWPGETEPFPDTTAGWITWHMEWWWTNTIAGVEDGEAADPLTFAWSGSADASRAKLAGLHDRWVEILTSTDPYQLCSAPFPEPQPLSVVAAWLNVELMKNVAELGVLSRLYANRS